MCQRAYFFVPLKNAVMMATYNPAKALKILNIKGEIKEGMDADIVVIDSDVNVYLTIVEGVIFYRNL